MKSQSSDSLDVPSWHSFLEALPEARRGEESHLVGLHTPDSLPEDPLQSQTKTRRKPQAYSEGSIWCGEIWGAGKSTLLNVLSGFIRQQVSGDILVDGRPRDMRTFRKLSCYIMQDDHLLAHLSVEESIYLAACLKIPSTVSDKDKKKANAVFLAPVVSIPILLFSGFFISLDTIPPYLKWLSYLSYIRYCYQSVLLGIYALERPELHCDKIFCPFQEPMDFLKEMDMLGGNLYIAYAATWGFFFAFRVAAYYVLWYRVVYNR